MERLTREVLREQGYTAIRSAGSKGVVDLAAINDHEVRLIQVKRQDALRPGDRQALSALRVARNTRVEIWEHATGAWRVLRWNPRQQEWQVRQLTG